MVSTRPSTTESSRPFNSPLVTVPKAPITIGTIVTFMFHGFFNSLARSRYLSFFFTFFQLYSVVSRDSKVDNFANSLSFFFDYYYYCCCCCCCTIYQIYFFVGLLTLTTCQLVNSYFMPRGQGIVFIECPCSRFCVIKRVFLFCFVFFLFFFFLHSILSNTNNYYKTNLFDP